MEINKELWKAYQQSYFFLIRQIPMHEFAIITACNPESHLISDRENDRRNRLLESEFSGYHYETIMVGDIKKNWIEESFAVELAQNDAVELAKKYQQNAIYYVSGGQLFLISCKGNLHSKQLGVFSEKIIYEKQI